MKKRYKIALVPAVIVISLFAVDFMIGYKQNKLLKDRAVLMKKLERLAWYSLESDIKDVTYSGERYRIELEYRKNPSTGEDLYVMTPAIRCFVQVGTLWKEVPVHEVRTGPEEAAVVKLEKPLFMEKLIEVPFRNFEEVFPGYMHVRVNSVAYVTSDAISKEDIAEKSEDFYVYLKPYYADDREVAKKYRFVNNVVPIWIPMPPH